MRKQAGGKLQKHLGNMLGLDLQLRSSGKDTANEDMFMLILMSLTVSYENTMSQIASKNDLSRQSVIYQLEEE